MGKRCYGQVTETGSKQLGPSQLPCPSVFFPSQRPHSTCIQTQLYLLPLLECSFTGSFSTAYPPSCAHSHLQWFAQTPTCQRKQSCTIITSSSNHSSTAAFLCPPCTFFPKASMPFLLSDLEAARSSFLMQETHFCVSSFLHSTFYNAHSSPSLSGQKHPPPLQPPAGSFLRQSYNYFIALSHFSISVLPTELDSPELKTWLWIM